MIYSKTNTNYDCIKQNMRNCLHIVGYKHNIINKVNIQKWFLQ